MRRILSRLFFISLVTGLVACGGDGTSISVTSIHGTVASGAGLKATVVIVDSSGEQTETSSDADGKYSVEMAGKSGPFIIKATAKTGNEVYFSYAAAFGVANVTELTTLAMTLAIPSRACSANRRPFRWAA